MTRQHRAQGSSPASAPTSALLAQVADALALPLLLLGEDARLRHANAAGQALLAAAGWLRLDASGKLTAGPSASAARALAEALAAAARGQRQWLRAPGAASRRVSLTVVRLPAQRGGEAVTLLLTVSDPGAAADLSAFVRHHGLTPAEARVLTQLCQGQTLVDAAAALGVSLATLRSHAAALRRKTGHRRLTTLLQAVARLPPLAAAPLPMNSH